MRDHINEMRMENGKAPLTEDELPKATTDDVFHYYVSQAINKILEAYNSGRMLEHRTVVWY